MSAVNGSAGSTGAQLAKASVPASPAATPWWPPDQRFLKTRPTLAVSAAVILGRAGPPS
ncbi:hypothetical protein APASM_3891 [Actinosynnema pretiosum subsp. pretiosum]|nr:hypothetical protein APASM_3891 [Actinosynnema pretiosum subsp. pretiosum]